MPYKIRRSLCPNCDLCLTCYTAKKAEFGRDAIYPFSERLGFGRTQHGAELYAEGYPRVYTLYDDIFLMPRLFSKGRERKRAELGREPIFEDVRTEVKIGGFKSKLPLVLLAMGSTDISNLRGIEISQAAAKSGIIEVIGENVYYMRGLEERKNAQQPTLMERIMAYLENVGDYGGLLVQANVEDRKANVWERVLKHRKVEEYVDEGKIGCEIKLGQGAKAGLGGEVKVSRELALELQDGYVIYPDPKEVDLPLYERHSVPGTLTVENLEEIIDKAKSYGVPVWIKTGGYREDDLRTLIKIASRKNVML